MGMIKAKQRIVLGRQNLKLSIFTLKSQPECQLLEAGKMYFSEVIHIKSLKKMNHDNFILSGFFFSGSTFQRVNIKI